MADKQRTSVAKQPEQTKSVSYCYAHSKPISECGCCQYCFEKPQNCICIFHKCSIGGERLPESELYEYRGAMACEKHFDEAIAKRDHERAEVIAENRHQTDRFKGLNMTDGVIGKANREILKTDIELAKKETSRTRQYEVNDLELKDD